MDHKTAAMEIDTETGVLVTSGGANTNDVCEVEQVPEIREALQELSIRVNQTQGAQANLLDKLKSVISQAPEIACLGEKEKEGNRYSCPLAQELWELSRTLANVTEIYMEETRKIQL